MTFDSEEKREIILLKRRISELQEKIEDQEKSLKEQRKKYQDLCEIVDLIAIPIVAIDKNFKLHFGNERAWKIMNLPEDIIDKMDVWSSPTLPEEEKIKIKNIYARLENGESPLVDELWVYMNGEKRLIRWVHDFKKDDSGEMRFFVATGTDITDLWQTTQELIKAKEIAEGINRTKERFISILSHDLKSPLISLGFMLNLFREKASMNVKEKESLLNRAVTITGSMIEMINTILQMSLYRWSGLSVSKVRIKTSDMVKKILSYFEGQMEYKRVVIQNTILKSHTIYADPNLFAVVLRNLLSNSIKFCANENEVIIYAPENQDNIISVKNSSNGIKADFLPHLFDDRVLTTTTGTGGEVGSGIGLPLCREIVEAHQGTIEVSSHDTYVQFNVKLPSD